MKSKKLKKAFAGLCTVALTVSSVPVSAQTEQTKAPQKESGLRLWYECALRRTPLTDESS